MAKLVNPNPTPIASDAPRPIVGQCRDDDAKVIAESTNPVSIAPLSVIRAHPSVMNAISDLLIDERINVALRHMALEASDNLFLATRINVEKCALRSLCQWLEPNE